MPEYKLKYFNTTGIGELIRFLLSYGDEDFEDIRYGMSSLAEIISSMPYGVLPVLEIDGKTYHQSLAIGRYLAKKYNLAGNNELEALEIDALVDTINDFRWLFTHYLWEPVAETKIEMKRTLINERIPYFLNKFRDQVEKNGGYFYGGRVTWADIFFTSVRPYLDFVIGFNILEDYMILEKLSEKIHAIPNIKKWIDKRPTSCTPKGFVA